MTQKIIEADIVAGGQELFSDARERIFEELSVLVGRGLLAEAHAMVPIVGTRLNFVATSRIAALTADVGFHDVQPIVNAVGKIPGLKVTRADYVNDSNWTPGVTAESY